MSDANARDPSVFEVSVAGLLHDIGKLFQRAHGGRGLPPAVRERAHDVLPQYQGRYSHWHALWSDWFFDLCERGGAEGLPWPPALDRVRVRNLAVFHHAPLQDYRAAPHLLLSELITRADRLAAGQERRPPEAEGDDGAPPDRRRAYLVTPLDAITTRVGLTGERRPWHHTPGALTPDALLPARELAASAVTGGYQALWKQFTKGWRDLCARAGSDAAAFEDGLLSLSEQTLWAVPSSTVDQPDISLHDHARAVAAFASALLLHHEAAGDLSDGAALRHGGRAKFRFLIGDLSGLQRTLFRLRSEGVPGLAKVLRGRSLRFQLIADAAVRRALGAFGMPMAAALQVAGGRFLALVPHRPEDEDQRRLDLLHAAFDDWMAGQYSGDLALGLALSAPFAPWDVMARPDEQTSDAALQRARRVRDGLAIAIETAKLRQLQAPAAEAVLKVDYPAGVCEACGVRPAREPPAGAATVHPDAAFCPACAAEFAIGQGFPKARAVVIGAAAATDRLLGLGYLLPLGEGAARHDRERGWRWGHDAAHGPAPVRAGPGWVARYQPGDAGRYGQLAAEEVGAIEEGQIKSFHALAEDATEAISGECRGRPMLALLKGDVDRLGRIFAYGLGESWSIARTAQLSRMMDLYFSLRLPHLLRERWPDSYTIYAGGDDFVLVLPWRQGLALASALATDFAAFAGGNPALTFSLGAALFDPRTPVSIAAAEAEARLDRAKEAGRNRISAIERRPMEWPQFSHALAQAERLNGWLRDHTLSTALLYRLLALDDARERIAAGSARPADYAWMARLGYTLARAKPEGRGRQIDEASAACRELFGIGADWKPAGASPCGLRLAITHALYRNR